MADGQFWCEWLSSAVSVTTGKILHGTLTPLTVWIEAARHATSGKNGVSAKTLHCVLGFGS